MTHAHRTTRGEPGWAIVQTLVVVVIASVLVAVAVPLVTSGARKSTLQQNAATLKYELGSYLAQGLDPAYEAADGAADAPAAAAVFTRALQGPRKRSAYYVNPFDGSRSIVCSPQLPPAGDDGPPAVWITNDRRYGYEEYQATAENKAHLRGTLVVAFLERDGRTIGIDIYYVDGDGLRSPTVALMAL
jgi:hypothetical protein